jgi:hypothetical protein
MNNENTLFLVTYSGDKHEDHSPKEVCTLGRIKNHVSRSTYEELLNAKDWVLDKHWIDYLLPEELKKFDCSWEKYQENLKEIKPILDKIKNDQDWTDEEVESLWGDILLVANFHPILMDSNNRCEFDFT